jgi:hypothetical protein
VKLAAVRSLSLPFHECRERATWVYTECHFLNQKEISDQSLNNQSRVEKDALARPCLISDVEHHRRIVSDADAED